MSLAKGDGSGSPTGGQDEGDDCEGDTGTDPTGSGRREATGTVLPDGLGHRLGLSGVEFGFSGSSELGQLGVGIASGLSGQVAGGAGIVDRVKVGGVVDEGNVGAGIAGVVARTSFPVHLQGDVLSGSQSCGAQVGEGETGGASVLDFEIPTDSGKVARRLRIGIGRVGKGEQLGVFNGGNRDVSSGCSVSVQQLLQR